MHFSHPAGIPPPPSLGNKQKEDKEKNPHEIRSVSVKNF